MRINKCSIEIEEEKTPAIQTAKSSQTKRSLWKAQMELIASLPGIVDPNLYLFHLKRRKVYTGGQLLCSLLS